MKHSTLIFFLFFLNGCNGQTSPSNSKPSIPELLRISYTSNFDQSDRNFFVYLPKGYHTDSLKKWPVIFHLHGNGARGDGKQDLIWVTKHGPLMEAWVQKRDLPFIIVVPQLQMMGMDTLKRYIAIRDTNTIPRRQTNDVPGRIKMDVIGEINDCQFNENIETEQDLPYPKTGNIRGWNLVEDDLLSILTIAQNKYRTNSNKTYLTGISYGAFGSWYISSTHPNIFAAITPISGWGHPDLMQSLAQQKIPIWFFSGCQDDIILTEDFYPGLRKLDELGLESYRFTIEPQAGHDVWKKVFAGEELYQWLLQQELNQE